MYREELITDLDELISRLYSFDSGFVFRGQSDSSWKLCSTLERIASETPDSHHTSNFLENAVKDNLKQRLHHYLERDELPSSELGWLSIAQHHGAPTRLLDFTQFPLVALYFATRKLKPTGGKFAIWAINFRQVNDDCIAMTNQKEYTPDNNPDTFFTACEKLKNKGAWIGEPRKVNLRLERQGGTFLIPIRKEDTIEDSLDAINNRSKIDFYKITAPASLIFDINDFLAKSGVTASRLFDGVDGLAEEISENLIHIITKEAPNS